jgi:hypothetical protein
LQGLLDLSGARTNKVGGRPGYEPREGEYAESAMATVRRGADRLGERREGERRGRVAVLVTALPSRSRSPKASTWRRLKPRSGVPIRWTLQSACGFWHTCESSPSQREGYQSALG